MKDAMKSLLEEKGTYYAKMANMCNEMLEGRPMAQVCRENDISVPTFRGRICKNESKISLYTSEQLIELTEGCLSPTEQIMRDALESDVFKTRAIALFDFPEDFDETVMHLIDEMDPRTSECIKLYYFDEMTYTDIGKKIGLSIERVRQIIHRGVWSLRRSDRCMRLIYGDKKYNECLQSCDHITEKENIIRYMFSTMSSSSDMTTVYNNLLDYLSKNKKSHEMHQLGLDDSEKGIEILNLDTRTFNTLWRRKIVTIGQVIKMTDSELLSLKNFGPRMLEDLDECLESKGFRRINSRS